MRKTLYILLSIILVFSGGSNCRGDRAQEDLPRLGVWITVFSPEKVLFSRESADRLLRTCLKTGVKDIYLQIYRADKAYYDSDITDRSSYEKMVLQAGTDPVDYILREAREKGLRVHAWINLLSIAHNDEANIIKRFGKDVITVDQHGRTSLKGRKKDRLDDYYIRENQLFLEPGDERVRAYLEDIAVEIVRRYPLLAGLHLDYIRYPVIVPFVPGSRFTSHGISYGYTERNLRNFRDKTGLDASKMEGSRQNFKKWDDWRRDQVTALVGDISRAVKEVSPLLEISCTIVPSMERTYLVTLQDWTVWLQEGYADYVVAMNYTDDLDLLKLNAKSLLLPGFEKEVHMGVGAYLLKQEPELIEEEIGLLLGLSPGGIVIFSYDDLAGNGRLQEYLAGKFLPEED
ncbi:MAG: family 10 glycosylhydrolase [Candidatus Omnitrophica bacterium]|nr:family 10 glycosylhydrolase [Candidatus Omnitrophota bacterium]